MNILGDSRIESGANGMWPGAQYPIAAPVEETGTQPNIGQQMHLVQTKIHELGVTLNRLYGEVPVDQEQVVKAKNMRSELRAENKTLREKLEAERVAKARPTSHSWTLARHY